MDKPKHITDLIGLKILRLICIIGISLSLILICLNWHNPISTVMGGFLFLFIWGITKTQREINDVKARNRILYLLNILLREMKDEGVADLKDFKRNKYKE